jgi:hypothetical protein
MSTGTLTGIHRTTVQTGTSMLATPDDADTPFLETPVRHRMLVDNSGDPFLFRTHGSYVAGKAFARAVGVKGTVVLTRAAAVKGTAGMNWDQILAKAIEEVKTIWDTPNLQGLLEAPLGAPVELTREEADEIVRLAFGRRPDLRPGKELVEEVRELLGHSLIDRLKEIE